ncbi:8-amino-7-oxononanoate synthase [Haloarculaceae archaeon H-GB2-1]|nr:8-amino-7-oxononanoate synthase [Haloarculaceae archaeon H-GB1-1]MEA5406714.1 8-amino-7-oxononanoate synthase [Haloarculaceae archaeon H-GB2-1]
MGDDAAGPTTTESRTNRERGFALEDRLARREKRGLTRDLEPAASVEDRTRFASAPNGDEPEFDGEELVFAANNYLGLAHDDRVQSAAAQASIQVGTGAGASRLVTGDTGLHRSLERDLADAKDCERALTFSSGYAANVGTITALAPDVVFSDERNHASIVDGCRLADAETVVYDHADPDALRAAMEARADEAGSWLVVTDSVFSMDGTVAPLSDLCDVAEEYGAWVMVDEAHATGVYDGGIVGRDGLGDRVQVQLGTLSKALASQGGFVAGSADLVDYLVNHARSFIFSTGLAPPAVGAAQEALRIARSEERQRQLWRNVEHLRDGLTEAGYDVRGETHILPVVVGDRRDALALADAVRDRGVMVPAIRPPAVPEGTSRLRVAPTATHTAADVQECLAAFRIAGREVGVL